MQMFKFGGHYYVSAKTRKKAVKILRKHFTVEEVINAECLLEPIKCNKCGVIGEVTYHQYIGDGYCNTCGEWQF